MIEEKVKIHSDRMNHLLWRKKTITSNK